MFVVLQRNLDAAVLTLAAAGGLGLWWTISETPATSERINYIAHAAFWIVSLICLRVLTWRQTLRSLHNAARILASLCAGLGGAILVADLVSGQAYTPSITFSLLLAIPTVIGARLLFPLPNSSSATLEDGQARHQEQALSVIFHELRRPLTTLVATSELAQDPGLTEQERERALQVIHKQGLRIGEFLEEILELARIQSGRIRLNLRQVELVALTRELCDEISEAIDGYDLKIITPDRPLCVAVDRLKLYMVVGNLIANATKYAPDGSTVTVRLWRKGRMAMLAVEDEGPGIPEPYRDQIFEPFFRIPGTPEYGLGLGLYIARQLVLAHGGTVTVENQPLGGARFTVALPLSRKGQRLTTRAISLRHEESVPTSGYRHPAELVHKSTASTQYRAAQSPESARR